MKYLKEFFKPVDKKQTLEFALVAILVALFISMYLKTNGGVVAAFILSIMAVLAPIIFYPFAVFWFGLSHALGSISSKILLTVVFFIIVVPVGLIRKLFGKDTLKIKQFKKSNLSVLEERNHLFTSSDIENTF
jgi:hypothetical protein